MADKKSSNTAAQAQSDKKKKTSFLGKVKNFFKGIAKYFKDTKSELKKVVWPSKKQILNNTGVVLIAIAISAVFIGGLDSILGLIVRFALGGGN